MSANLRQPARDPDRAARAPEDRRETCPFGDPPKGQRGGDDLGRNRREMSDAMLANVARRFRALAEPARLRLLQILLDGERSVGDLVEAGGLSQASTSKHLATLHESGLVVRRKDGATVYYSVVSSTVPRLCDLMCGHVNEHASAQLESLGSASTNGRRRPTRR